MSSFIGVVALNHVDLARRVAEFRHPDIHIRSGVREGGGYAIFLVSRLTNFEVVVWDDGTVLLSRFVGKVSDMDPIMQMLSLAQGILKV